MEEKINKMRQLKAKTILVVFGALGLYKKKKALRIHRYYTWPTYMRSTVDSSRESLSL